MNVSSRAKQEFLQTSSKDTVSTPTTDQEFEALARCFNTALISTRAETQVELNAELKTLLETPAYREILRAAFNLSRNEGVSEARAAEELIRTFRKLDQIWAEYVFLEGVSRLQDPATPEA